MAYRFYEIRAGSDVLPFHVYTGPSRVPGEERRIRAMEVLFRRMPPAHRHTVYPIFVVNTLPGSRGSGGGRFPNSEVRSLWLGRSTRTGVPDADVQRYVLDHNTGLIGITAAALADEGRDQGVHRFTLFHEIGHCVDDHIGLVPSGGVFGDFRGQRYRRSPGNVRELAVEAYSRWIVAPARVCRDDELPAGESQAACTRRTLDLLWRSPAFRGIPQT